MPTSPSVLARNHHSPIYYSFWDAASHYLHHCAYLETHQKSTHPTKTQLQYLSIAKKTILLKWKNRDQLSISQELNLLSEYISMEQTSALIRKQTENLETKGHLEMSFFLKEKHSFFFQWR